MTQSATAGDDDDLLSRARQFDPQALGQIYDAYFERLSRYAYRFVDGPEAAQDIASETLRRFLEALRDSRGPDRHLAAWLYRVAHHLAIDAYRRAPPAGTTSLDPELSAASDADTEAAAEIRIARARVRDALTRLTPDQQHVILLKFVEGYTNAEIGSLMRKPEGAIKSLQHRALATLRRLLEPSPRRQP